MTCKLCYFTYSKLRYQAVSYSSFRTYAKLLSPLQKTTIRTYSRSKDDESFQSLFKPVTVQPTADDINIGEELTTKLEKNKLRKILTKFYQRKEIRQLSAEAGLDNMLFHQAYMSFRRYCMESEVLPVDLHITLSDAIQSAGHTDDIYPYFLCHAKKTFPHLECMDDLTAIGDLSNPSNWYPEARAVERNIIFHAGPTNSGKTYHALNRFLSAKSGIYCGPLKLLANEVFHKSNEAGTPCDLVTGEERIVMSEDGEKSAHTSCTVEMANVHSAVEVAVIDEIQMLRDYQRGWAWTRALLGICADEIHVCGEAAAINIVKDMVSIVGEDLEVRKYKRLTGLRLEDSAVGTFNNIRDGDCIVCFNKQDVYKVTREVEKMGKPCGVIYGALPPGTKLNQARRFNDPDDPCKVLVSTDAIGMGLNLSIRRLIFYSVVKPNVNLKGELEIDTIPPYLAVQIAGRAGRYGTQYSDGSVTTFKPDDLPTLKALLEAEPEDVTKAGIGPTADQIELFAYHLPNATMSNLMDIFVKFSTLDDSLFFMVNVEDFKLLADMIEHVPLELRARYVFCCAPIKKQFPLLCTMFQKFARQYSNNQTITYNWMCNKLGWPFTPPQTILDMVHLEEVFDSLDLYLWLSYRFPDMFPDTSLVRELREELDLLIQEGIQNIASLVKNSQTKAAAGGLDEDFILSTRKLRHQRGPAFLPEESIQPSSSSRSARAKVGGGNLTDKLIKDGLLTQDMLDELHSEWKDTGPSITTRLNQLIQSTNNKK